MSQIRSSDYMHRRNSDASRAAGDGTGSTSEEGFLLGRTGFAIHVRIEDRRWRIA
jgi:hypothetical protein